MAKNIEAASRELRHPYSRTAGDIEFLSEENYGKAKTEYETYRQRAVAKSQEVYDPYLAQHVQEAKARLKKRQSLIRPGLQPQKTILQAELSN